jgi:site-specific recombinase XerD
VWGESGLVQALERTCKRLGIPKHRYHALRHFFVTSLFRGGVPAHDVQRLAGHAALGTTAGYAHHTAQGLRDAIAVLDRGNGVETAPRAQNQDVE